MRIETKTEMRSALQYFMKYLRESRAKDYIAKVFLFGSLANGEAKPESDVDILVVCQKEEKTVFKLCMDAQMEVYYRFSESVESLVYPMKILKNTDSCFTL